MADARPFIKFVGGKTQLLPELLKRMPQKYGTYWEPFVGGGALFFAVKHTGEAVINDANSRLIQTYNGIRDHVENVIGILDCHGAAHSEDFYYKMREHSPDHLGTAGIAAWMIYMNKTGFNGLYRVNKSGGFNVPWGKHAAFTPDRDNLRACSEQLKKTHIFNYDFRKLFDLASVVHGDFVYFDCPYAPLTATSDFASYTKEGFSPEDQRDLRDLALSLKSRGVHVLLSNSSAPLIRELYSKGFDVQEVSARRSVNSKAGGRGAIKELLIS